MKPVLTLLTWSTLLSAAHAQIPFPGEASSPGTYTLDLKGRFSTSLIYRNDSDFDSSDRYFDRDGQSEGQLATFLRPDLTFSPEAGLKLFYQAELGWNVWSRNNPDEWRAGSPEALVVKHRELYADWTFAPGDSVKVGYQHFRDPSGLFLNHWGGAARLEWSLGEGDTLRVLAGQLPDTTYEGLDLRDDNFVHDTFVGGLETRLALDGPNLDLAIYGLGDFRTVDRPLYLGTAVLALSVEERELAAWLHLVGQFGTFENSGLGGEDQTIAAYAVQVGGRWTAGRFELTANGLLLSADDQYDGNERQSAFFGSAKNRSPTLILTEDEYRDRYDNLDERLASRLGAFSVGRAGLSVVDMELAYAGFDMTVPRLVVGGAFVLNPENALGERFVGVEADWIQELHFTRAVGAYLMAQLFVPGKAAAAYVNEVDRTATENVYGAQAGFVVQF